MRCAHPFVVPHGAMMEGRPSKQVSMNNADSCAEYLQGAMVIACSASLAEHHQNRIDRDLVLEHPNQAVLVMPGPSLP